MGRLLAPHMERCVGCFLCVLVSAREEGSLSLEDSGIRIVRKGESFTAEIDPGFRFSPEVARICPRNCLTVVD